MQECSGGAALSVSRMRAGVYDEVIGLDGQYLGWSVMRSRR